MTGLIVLCLATGGALSGGQTWLALKARLALYWIDRAFAAHLADGGRHRPWAWADTWPVAELSVPRLGVRRVVLAGATGPSLAFGPGHVDGTALPNRPGNAVVAGHRDHWFAFLEELVQGDRVRVRSRGGTRDYVVTGLRVHDLRDAAVLEQTEDPRLTLITCWPFDGLRRTPLRYVVTAEPDPRAPRACPRGYDARRGGQHDRPGAANLPTPHR